MFGISVFLFQFQNLIAYLHYSTYKKRNIRIHCELLGLPQIYLCSEKIVLFVKCLHETSQNQEN